MVYPGHLSIWTSPPAGRQRTSSAICKGGSVESSGDVESLSAQGLGVLYLAKLAAGRIANPLVEAGISATTGRQVHDGCELRTPPDWAQ